MTNCARPLNDSLGESWSIRQSRTMIHRRAVRIMRFVLRPAGVLTVGQP
jgi:hypothetical protein